MSKRLSEVAEEFNLGSKTIVEHLRQNGFEISDKPNTKLSLEMYDSLHKQFQQAKDTKAKAEELSMAGQRKNEGMKNKPKPWERASLPNKEPQTIKDFDTLKQQASLNKDNNPETGLEPVLLPTSEIIHLADDTVVSKNPPAVSETPKEESNLLRGETPTLRGPKILGKIILDEKKPPQYTKPNNNNQTSNNNNRNQQQNPKKDQPAAGNNTPNNNNNRDKDRSKTNNGDRQNNTQNSKNNPSKTEQRPRIERNNAPNTQNNTGKDSANNRNQKSANDKPKTESTEPKTVVATPKVEDNMPLNADITPNEVLPIAEHEDPTSDTYRAETPTLRGFKILGKIDLNKPKPVATSNPNPAKNTQQANQQYKKNTGESTPNNNNRERNRNRQGGENQPKEGGNQNQTNNGGGENNRNRPRQNPENRNNQNQPQNNAGANTKDANAANTQNPQEPKTTPNNSVYRKAGTYTNNQTNGGGNGGNNNRAGGAGANNQNRKRTPLKGKTDGTIPATTDEEGTGRKKTGSKKKETDDAIKATLAKMQVGGLSKKRGNTRSERADKKAQRLLSENGEEEELVLQLTEFISVSEFASLMDTPVTDIITTCMNLGIFVSINQRLDADVIELVADEYGYRVEFISAEEQMDMEEDEEVDAPEDLIPRAPIVTVMGHVDHGKTSLLDYIRKANVMGGEAGGITQHIGAYEVTVPGSGKITFLDTPGHEAFTAMRARGAKVTDIAVIIIAADDSIMPQTKEAISHAQAANVPMVFAINKVDKEGAQPEKIKQELASMNLLVEDWGGKYQSQEISAKKGLNVDALLEKILLEAELLDLKGNPNRRAIGTVLEASLEKGRGYVSKILVQTGTLKIGDAIVAGQYSGKVKAMFNERGKNVKAAGPATPVLVLGLEGAPQAGEKLKVLDSERTAKELANKRAQIARQQQIRATKRMTLDEIARRLKIGNFRELNLIVKGDMDGSVEALSDSLIKLSNQQVQTRIVFKAVGPITESDVHLAAASDAIIVGFQVRPNPTAKKLAEQEGVQIKTYSIIYDAIDEIKSAIEGLLQPKQVEKELGSVEIRQVFEITKIGKVAGCFVTDGKINRNNFIRVVRNGIVIYPNKENTKGELASLKRIKDNVMDVKAGFECGLTIKNFDSIQVGDVLEAYEIVEVKQTLEDLRKEAKEAEKVEKD